MSSLITTSLLYPKHYYFFIYLVGLTPQSFWEWGSTPHVAHAIEVVSESLDQKHMRPDVSHNSRNQWWCPGFAPTVFATATPAAEVAMCDSTYYIFLILLGSSHFEKPVDRNKQIARFVLSLQLSIVLENRDVLGRGSHVRKTWICEAMCDSTYYIFLTLLGSSHFEKPADRDI